jgi:predicted DNA-binding transcriptional regulator YafY
MSVKRTVRKAHRLIEMREMFHRDHTPRTVVWMVERWGVSTRTIERDLLELETEMGVPLEIDRLGRYSLAQVARAR